MANPSFVASDIDTNANYAYGITSADLDNDGDLDLVSASYGDDTIAWYESDVASNNDTAVMAQAGVDTQLQVEHLPLALEKQVKLLRLLLLKI